MNMLLLLLGFAYAREGYQSGIRLGGQTSKHDGVTGFLFDVSGFYSQSLVAIEPRLGTSMGFKDNHISFFELPFDCGLYLVPFQEKISPVIGGSVGGRYIYRQFYERIEIGNTIPMIHEKYNTDSAVGLSVSGRFGIMLIQEGQLSILVRADYNVTFVEVQGVENPQSISYGISFLF